MKKITLLFVALLSITVISAQEKLKGNKNVTTQHREILPFNAILIKDNLKVIINESPESKVSVETDENLQQAITTRVSDEGVLEVYISQEIGRKKKLKIYIGVTDSIQRIETRDNASILGENEIHCKDMNLIAQDNSTIKMKFRLDNISINADDRSDLEITASTKNDINIALDHNASVKINGNSKSFNVNLNESCSLKATGNSKNLKVIANDNGSFKGKELLADYATVQATDRSDVYVNVSKELLINLENNAEIYIFDEPKITIEKFTDKASIFKK